MSDFSNNFKGCRALPPAPQRQIWRPSLMSCVQNNVSAPDINANSQKYTRRNPPQTSERFTNSAVNAPPRPRRLSRPNVLPNGTLDHVNIFSNRTDDDCDDNFHRSTLCTSNGPNVKRISCWKDDDDDSDGGDDGDPDVNYHTIIVASSASPMLPNGTLEL